MEIIIQDIIGNNCITRQEGQKIFDMILSKLKQRETVRLDFTGVGVFASPFFNSSVGPLFKDFTRDELRDLLVFDNINPVGKNLLRIVIDNSSKYFADELYRKMHDDVISQQDAEEEDI